MNTQTSGEAGAHLLTLVRHKHVARRFAVLEHVSGSCIEQRKEDVVRAEHQTLVLQRTREDDAGKITRIFCGGRRRTHLGEGKKAGADKPIGNRLTLHAGVSDWHREGA